MLAGPDAAPLWGLPAGTTLAEIWCEAPFNPDDNVLLTSDGGLIFGQAKSGVVALSKGAKAPLRQAFAQFVARYVGATPTRDFHPWERPLEGRRDRLVLFVEPRAGRLLAHHGRLVLERLRAAPTNRHPLRSELAECEDDGKALDCLRALVRLEWVSQEAHEPADEDVWSLLRLVHIQSADVSNDGPEGREARDALSRLTHKSCPPGHAWAELLELMLSAQVRGGPTDAERLADKLADRGVPFCPLPRVAPDIEALRARTRKTLASLSRNAALPGPAGPVSIHRPVVAALAAACTDGYVVVVGEAGAGKTAVLAHLTERLLAAGRDAVLLNAEDLASGGPGALTRELGLALDLRDVLGGWVGPGSAVIVVDALDACRDRSTLLLLTRLIRDLGALPRWTIVVSIREYDLLHGPEIQELFRGSPPSPEHMDPRFGQLRHVAVARLSDAELDDATPRLPGLARVLALGQAPLRRLLKSPFNLRLAAELLLDEVAATDVATAGTRVALLDLYWSYRVRDLARERALELLVDEMVARRALQLDEGRLRAVLAIASTTALEELLRDSVLVKQTSPHGHDVAFAHHVLFDYAVARLKLRRPPEDLASYLRDDPDRVLAVLPSIRMHFELVWGRQADRKPLWDLLFHLGNDSTVPTIVRRLGVATAVDLAREPADLEPLLWRVETRSTAGVSAAPAWAMTELVGALNLDENADRVRRGGELWPSVARRLSENLGAEWDPVAMAVCLLVKLLSPHAGQLTHTQRCDLGAVARRLLGRAWANARWRPGVASVALAGVCRTYGSDPAASADLLRRCFEPDHLAKHDCRDVPVIAREIDQLLAGDADLVAEVYERVFAHAPAAPDETTILSESQILGMTSNRRQDYAQALYSLHMAFPRLLDAAPAAATRALIRVVRNHAARRHRVSAPDTTVETFTVGGLVARTSRDYSRLWDSGPTFHESERGLLAAFEGKLVEHAEASDGAWIDTVLGVLASENILAAPWRRVLAAAARVPAVLGLCVADALESRAILLAYDLRDNAGVLLAAVYPLLDLPHRERLERTIMALPEQETDGTPEWGHADWRRRVLVGRLRDQELCTLEASTFIAELLEGDELPEDTPDFEVHSRFVDPLTVDGRFEEQGIDVASPGHRALVAVRDPVKAFCDSNSNREVDPAAAELALAAIRGLRDCLDSEAGARLAAPVRGHAMGVLAAGAERAVGAVAPGSEGRALLVDILLHASRSEDPGFSPAQEEQFDGFPAWGWPAARLHAAEGLLAAARAGAEPEVLDAIDRLADDQVGAVRLGVAARLPLLAQSAPEAFRRIAERRLAVEASTPVLVPLVDGSLPWLAQRDAERAFWHVSKILERFPQQQDLGSRQDVRRPCVLLLARWYLWTENGRAEAYADRLAADPLADPGASRLFAASMGQHLLPDADESAAVNRAWRFIERLCAAVVAECREWRVRHDEDPASVPPKTFERAKAAMEIGTELTFRLLVGCGANREHGQGAAAPTEAQNRWFLERAAPLVEGLSELPSAQSAFDLVQMLESLIAVDPARVFLLLSRTVSRGTSVGLEYEQLVSDLIVRIVEAYLAQHRDVFRIDVACRAALLSLLALFADAGWPAARRLLYGLDEIYR